MTAKSVSTDTLAVNTLRVLSMDAIDKANSGHPGIALGAAPIVYELFKNNLVFNPKNPKFCNRDRFILSAGHGSMLNYAVLHLFGYDVPMKDIESFRQLGSVCTGHPEVGVCPGIETTTGPLGQGFANAVGMAIAEARLAEKFNREGFPVVDHYTYVLSGDGCMQEGIENEAASLAGTLKLGKLIAFYDDNGITIEGNTDVAFSEDVKARHEALGWQVLCVKDACDLAAIRKAIEKAKKETKKPSLIIVRSVIGYGSPLAGSEASHGAPLGKENNDKTRETLGFDYPPFTVPEPVKEIAKEAREKGAANEKAWKELFTRYEAAYPELAKEFKAWTSGKLPALKDESLWEYEKDDASRGYGSITLNRLKKLVPNLFGGSADLGPSNKTVLKGAGDFTAASRAGDNLHYGIREHAMAAIANGVYLHGGLRPYAATFFVFADYMRGAMRMSAIMKLPVLYILTHDSVGVGEDGPTHEPVEHLSSLRAMPNMRVFRPADGKETTAAYISALSANAPTVLALSRQTLPRLQETGKDALKGGYVLKKETGKTPDVILIATGSEVKPTLDAASLLMKDGADVRVVSMPCQEVFDEQDEKYRESVLPSSVRARVAVEAGASQSWYRYVGLDGAVVGIDRFGESAPAKTLFERYGFTAENIASVAKSVLKK